MSAEGMTWGEKKKEEKVANCHGGFMWWLDPLVVVWREAIFTHFLFLHAHHFPMSTTGRLSTVLNSTYASMLVTHRLL